jgi:hypothetical protein
LVGSGRNEERLQPLLVLGADDIGCSESREEGNTPRFIGAPMTQRGSFTQGLPAHAAHRSNSVSSPLLPAGQTIGLSSRHRKVRHVAREGRCGEERQTAWLFGSSMLQGNEQSKRGQGRQPRTEEDRRLTGVPACRNRVAEIGSRNRGSEKRRGVPLPEWKSSSAWAGARPRGGNLGPSCVARRTKRPERFE